MTIGVTVFAVKKAYAACENYYCWSVSTTFISQTGLPATMTPNQTATVTLTYRYNVTGAGCGGNCFPATRGDLVLHSEDAHLNTRWAVNKVDTDQATIAVGQNFSYTFQIRAPATPGSYTFSWRVYNEGVVGDCPTPPQDGCIRITPIPINPIGQYNSPVSITVVNVPTPTPSVVSCSPNSQNRQVGQAANLSASGGNGGYSWSAPGGSPLSGNAANFNTVYSTVGTKTVTVSSNGTSRTCTVVVSNTPTPTPPPPSGTLSVDLTAATDGASWQQVLSGTSPYNGVDLKATVSGTVTGTINYTFYCNRTDTGTNVTSPWSSKRDGQNINPYIENNLCNYAAAGTYRAKVIVERGSAPAVQDQVVITVTAGPTGGLLGRIVHDANENGAWNTGELYIRDPLPAHAPCTSEESLSGFVINYSGPITGQVTGDACNPEPLYGVILPIGTYTISLTVPAGWHLTNPLGSVTVTIPNGGNVTQWFYVNNTAGPTLASRLWMSPNGQSWADAWNDTAPFSSLYLRGEVVGSAVGPYTYTFYCDNPAGSPTVLGSWIRSETTFVAPTLCPTYQNPGDYNPHITIAASGVPNATDFDPLHITAAAPGTVLGRIWNDADGNGALDAGELYIKDPSGAPSGSCTQYQVLDGVEVRLTNIATGIVTTTRANQCGLVAPPANDPFYSLQLAPGTYDVSLGLPASWVLLTQTPPTRITVSSSGFYNIWFGIRTAPPTINVTANGSEGPISLPRNGPRGSLRFDWNSTNAVACTATKTGDNLWITGSVAINQVDYEPWGAAGNTGGIYTITCNGYGGWVTDSVTVNITNTAPSVSIGNPVPPDYCTVNSPVETISWTFSDSDPDDVQAQYYVQFASNASFTQNVYNTGVQPGEDSSFTIPPGWLQFGRTYYIRVRVWDNHGQASSYSATRTFLTPNDPYPQAGFTFSPARVHREETVQFTDASSAQGGASITGWSWVFGGCDSVKCLLTGSGISNPQNIFHQTGSYPTTLRVTDSNSNSCTSTPQTIEVERSIPSWKEVAPQ